MKTAGSSTAMTRPFLLVPAFGDKNLGQAHKTVLRTCQI
jgi:hypothetical protein